jgi:predicted Zn-dependent protease
MHAALGIVVAAFLSMGGAPVGSVQLAEAAADSCQYQAALEILSQAPAAEQASRVAKLLRARLLIQLRRGSEAIGILEGMGRAETVQEEADRQFALALAQSAAFQLREAERSLTRAARAGAERDLVDSTRALLRIQQGKFEEAEKLLRAVLRRDPLLSGALYHLAVVRLRSDDLAEAAALIRQAWHAGLQDPMELKTDPDLKKLRDAKGLIDDLLSAPMPKCSNY